MGKELLLRRRKDKLFSQKENFWLEKKSFLAFSVLI